MSTGELIMRTTIWVALVGYVIGESGRLAWRKGQASHWRGYRWVSTVACAFYILHVAFAFDEIHQWSHAEAYRFTAAQTKAMFGLNWGGGLFVNYLFAAVWLTELAAWWLRPSQYQQRRRWLDASVRVFFAFIILNGAVVFVSGPTRWIGVGLILLLSVGFYRFRP
ncbi:MAG: hypothetical protein AAF591_19385 [Verrucomicrobiota bacterium]